MRRASNRPIRAQRAGAVSELDDLHSRIP